MNDKLKPCAPAQPIQDEADNFNSIYKYLIKDREAERRKMKEELRLEEAAKSILYEAGYPQSWVEILNMFKDESKLKALATKLKLQVFK